jgi:hypothetical protein
MTELNEQQRHEIALHPETPVVLTDPATQSQYVLVPAETYERWRALLSGGPFRVEDAYPLMNQVGEKEGWDDPALDVYSQLDPRKKT